MKKALLIFASLTFTLGLQAATFKGHISDGKSKESLIGAVIYNEADKKQHDVAGLDGGFAIKGLNPGTYNFEVTFIGYVKMNYSFTIKEQNEVLVHEYFLEPEAINTSEVVVRAERDKETDAFAREVEKKSDNIMNTLSAKSIQMLPDLTIGAVLQRVSGVTVTKNSSGEGKWVNIRGMDKRYNLTLIDGIRIPSSDNKSKSVPMDLFPSEMVERMDVIKTLTPDLDGDVTGGIMNLILRNAPEKFMCSASVSTGYSQELLDRPFKAYNPGTINPENPQTVHPGIPATIADFPLQPLQYKAIHPMPNLLVNFTIGDRFFKDKLGVIFSAGYQDIFSGSHMNWIKLDAQPQPAPVPNTPLFDDIQIRQYSVEDKRGNVQAKFDWQFNPKHRISFYTTYVNSVQLRQRNYSDTLVSVPVGQIEHHYESRTTIQNIYNATLKGQDSIIPGLNLDWGFAYNVATGNLPDWTTYNDINNAWSQASSRWQSNIDQNISQSINLTYSNTLFGQKFEVKTGASNRNTSRDNYYDDYSMDLSVLPTAGGIYNMYLPHGNPQFHIVDSLGTPNNANNYYVHENIWAAYGMAKVEVGKRIELVGGIRTEGTNQYYWVNESQMVPAQHSSRNYMDYLPSVQGKFKITDKQAIRLGYFASLTRPDFYEIIPYQLTGETYDEIGNPSLHHSTTDNLDLRYEFFPKPGESYLVGAFYKTTNNVIEYYLARGAGPSAQYIQPINDSNPATNYGIELVANRAISKHFSVSANYTYTHSELTSPKRYEYLDSKGHDTYKTINETLPMQGQVDHIANVSLHFNDFKYGWDASLTFNYQGKSIAFVSSDYGFSTWQMPSTHLNLTVEKRLSKKYNIYVFGKIRNLLNTPLEYRVLEPEPAIYKTSNAANPSANFYLPGQVSNGSYNSSNSIVVQREVFGQSYLVGLRFKF